MGLNSYKISVNRHDPERAIGGNTFIARQLEKEQLKAMGWAERMTHEDRFRAAYQHVFENFGLEALHVILPDEAIKQLKALQKKYDENKS